MTHNMLIGLCGKARVGKNSVANILVEDGHLGTNQYSFAKPIKDVCNALFDWEEGNYELPFKEDNVSVTVTQEQVNKAEEIYTKYGLNLFLDGFEAIWRLLGALGLLHENRAYGFISPRRAYQVFGTDVMRDVLPNVWTTIAPSKNVIITDVRLMNEVEWIKKHSGILVYINRPDVQQVAAHASEREFDKIIESGNIDYIIENNGTLEDLKAPVNRLIETIINEDK